MQKTAKSHKASTGDGVFNACRNTSAEIDARDAVPPELLRQAPRQKRSQTRLRRPGSAEQVYERAKCYTRMM